MKLKVVCTLFVVLLTLIPSVLLNQETCVKADEGENNPLTEVIDYHNGTVRTIVDYGNGTQDHTIETTIQKTATFHNTNGSNFSLFLAKSNESQLQTAKVTETKMMQEEVIMGFTKEILKERYQILDVNVLIAYFRLWIDFDFEFGLRLPVNITVEYPVAVTFDGSIEELNVTIIPIDKPDFNEFLCVYQISMIVEAGKWVGLHWEKYGPYKVPVWGEDRSKSFRTPMGDNIAFPIGPWPVVNIFDTWFVSVSLGVAPGFGSKKVTATASAFGDSNITGSNKIEWSEPNQTFPLEVQFGGIDPSSQGAKITISHFRYYFTEFALGFYLMVDFTSWIDWLIKDFNILLFKIPMSWVYKYLGYYYVSSEQTVDLWFGPQNVRRDIAVTSVFCNVNEILQGGLVNIAVVVENLGASTEIFNITAFYDDKPINTIPNEILENGTSRAFHFIWNTSSVAIGSYIIKAEATQVPNEFDIHNNVKVDESVRVRVLYELCVNVVDNAYKPISGAKVEINGLTEFTPENGSTTFVLPEGIYNVQASKDSLSNTAEVNLNQDMTITLMLATPPTPVGGKATPINKAVIQPQLQTPWIWLSMLILPLVATVVLVKHKKKKQ